MSDAEVGGDLELYPVFVWVDTVLVPAFDLREVAKTRMENKQRMTRMKGRRTRTRKTRTTRKMRRKR